MDTNQIIKRFNAAKSDRQIVQQTWQAIELFIRPHSGKFFRDNSGEASIEWRRRNVYDSTAVMAAQSLSSSLHGVLTSPAMRWFNFQYRNNDLRDDHEASLWLENAALVTYDSLQDSNFNLEINETYRDITSFGTGFLVEEPVVDIAKPWQGVEFTSVKVKEAYFEEDEYGAVKVFYRHMEWTASRIVDKFGIEKVPDKIKQAYERGDDQAFDIVFCVFPKDLTTPEAQKLTETRTLLPENRPYQYRYICLEGKTELERGGYYENPVYAPRWLTTSESRWGHSPATIALADVLTLNQLVELVLKSAEKVIDPAILMNERAGFTDLSLGAGEVSVGRDIDGIRTFESGARFDVAQLRVEDLRNNIRQYFFVDQLALKESPAMTATEVQVRYELMHRLLSGTMARLRQDLLHPLVSRTFKLLFRAGQLGDPPASVGAGVDVDIEYLGPLARAQRAD
ncbi:MAG: portal protein, partial [Planctomycetota bacterium]